jgi:hypothetical protein
MKVAPIALHDHEVRSILSPSADATQLRRALTPQPEYSRSHSYHGKLIYQGERSMWSWKDLVLDDLESPANRQALALRCPLARPGDRLWVKETWGIFGTVPGSALINYRASHEITDAQNHTDLVLVDRPQWRWATSNIDPHHWRPGHNMPQWASRLLLEVTDVRVERLLDISETDAKASGFANVSHLPSETFPEGDMRNRPLASELWSQWDLLARDDHFPSQSNPWVWVLVFRALGRDGTPLH